MIAEAADGQWGWETGDYELLDFGEGRKLEKFGRLILDRVCPAADEKSKAEPSLWDMADLRLNAKGKVSAGRSENVRIAKEDWSVRFGAVQFRLKLTPFGHVGLFPEQAFNWSAFPACDLIGETAATPRRALNLFAYTGGTTMVLAAKGWEVVHVDASAPSVSWARENALQSGLSQHSIRWIVEDARKFVAREFRRGNRYDLVVLDPPSFGHGPKGQRWAIGDDLEPLLRDCCALLEENHATQILLTAHSADPNLSTAKRLVEATASGCAIESGRLKLTDRNHRHLDTGYYIRATRGSV